MHEPLSSSGQGPALDFHALTRVLCGPGRVESLGSIARELGFARTLVVSDPGVVRAGHVERAVESLRGCGVEAFVFDGVEENPTADHVERGLEAARAAGIDSLVGIGGGSAMDCAKGINFLFSCGGRMADYWGIGKATRAMLPMVAVPTTAGTGSEAQSFALISDPVTHRKMACGDRRACCRVAILDPELTLTLPHSVTAATGMDAISHAVESFVTTRRTPISQAFSREAWRLLAGSFPTVLLRPDDIGARGSMLLGACLAGFAIENSMLGATHSLANPLTAEFGVPHGIAIGLMLPHVVRFNAQVVNGDFAELAALVPASPGSGSGAERVARCVEELRTAAGMPARLRECGVEEGRLSALSASAAAEWTARHNPRPVGPSDLEELYRCAY